MLQDQLQHKLFGKEKVNFVSKGLILCSWSRLSESSEQNTENFIVSRDKLQHKLFGKERANFEQPE